jgi:hypothetical protein
MPNTVRIALVATAGIAALLAGTAGVALADTPDDGNAHHPNGTGSGLSGGPTPTQVLPDGAAPIPLSDPTLGVGTLAPPAYNVLGGITP